MIDFFDDLKKMSEEIHSNFNRSLSKNLRSKTSSRVPFADVQELESSFLISVEVPGVSKEDLVVEVEDNKLCVSGSSKNIINSCCENSEKTSCSFNNFFRSFKIPNNCNVDEINASHENGILRVTLPKKEKADKKKININ